MAQLAAAEWILLSEVFRGKEEKCHQLLKKYPNPDLLSRDWSQFMKEGLITREQYESFQKYELKTAEQYEKECSRKGIQIITPDSEDYPTRLYHYLDPPIVLYAAGDTKLLNEENMLTIVGTRAASEYARKTAFLMSREVANRGIIIVSGCAVGIDAAAHYGALAAGGKTIAILGCAIDFDYPHENYRLRKKMVADGSLLISEYPPGTRPQSHYFPHRNRLLAGLSRAVMVGEAPYKSGSLITAEYAVEQGKEVFCVPPYSIWDPRCSGVIRYLRDGATPVFSPADILLHYFTLDPSMLSSEKFLVAALDLSHGKAQPGKMPRSTRHPAENPFYDSSRPDAETSEENASESFQTKREPNSNRWVLPPQITDQRFRDIFAVLRETPIPIDEIVAKSQVAPADVMTILSELELLGLAENHSGNRYSVKFEPKNG